MAKLKIIEWSSADIEGHPVSVGSVSNGFLIASVVNPRFCFHGRTKEEALGEASRALAFYRKTRASLAEEHQEKP